MMMEVEEQEASQPRPNVDMVFLDLCRRVAASPECGYGVVGFMQTCRSLVC